MPDLNTVPVSPRNPTSNPTIAGAQAASSATSAQASRQSSTTASRRASQIYPMSPPPLPLTSPGGTIPVSTTQHAHAAAPQSPSLSGSVEPGVPMRHPRPLTAAELHLELEKEQEAVVNRLTRELSALRAHSASVASTASSVTSGMHMDQELGPTHPTSARRHRSSSSVSRTSASAPHGIPLNPATATIPHHRYSVSSQNATSDPSAAQQARSASVVSTPRYEEVAHYRQELEEAKRENEVLKRRIRELEKALRGSGDAADAQRGRTGAPTSAPTGAEAAATTATNASPGVPSSTSS